MSLSQSFSQKIGNVRPLNPCPSLDIDFANGGYVNTGGFANQESVGSANFKIGAFNGPDPIFTRATAATFRGSNGLIQYAPENLIKYSEQFDNPYWVNIAGQTTNRIANQEIAPDGTNTADLIWGNLNKYTALGPNYTENYQLGEAWTYSVYFKKQLGSPYGFVFVNVNRVGAGDYGVIVDLSNGSYFLIGNIDSPSATVKSVGNGWYRVSYTLNNISVSGTWSSNSIRFFAKKTSSQSENLSNGDGLSSSGIYVWGAQFERSSAARPYISTTTAPRYGPRFEYDTSGNPLGLLMEEQSQNLVYPSSTLTTQTRTVTAAPHTLSFYGTGSVSLSGATTGTVIGSGANTRTVYTFTPTAGSLTLTVSGSVTSAQLEQKPFATSYIPTVSGSVTRNADVVSSTIGSWYNADEGTIVVKGDRTGFNIQDSLFEFTSGTTASLAHRGDGTDENFLVEDAGTTVTIVETIPLNSPLYFAASYSDPATQVNATVNAEPVQGTTLASTITTPTTLNIGYSPEISTYFNGHIKAFRYYAKDWPSKLEFFTLTA